MVDVVVNHFASPGPAKQVNYSGFNPFNDASFYHSYCEITNYDDQDMVERCWLGDTNVELVDMKTDDLGVLRIYQLWISALVSNYSSGSIVKCLLKLSK
jgi:alpha-amylase